MTHATTAGELCCAVQKHVDAVGIAPSGPASRLSSLYRYAALARVCEMSTSALWSLRASGGRAEPGRRLLQQTKPLLRLAAERLTVTLAEADLAIPAVRDRNVALRRALEVLPMLASQYQCAPPQFLPRLFPARSACLRIF